MALKKPKIMRPVHAGVTLMEDFLKPMGMSPNRLALELRVPATRVGDIVRGRRAITADTSLRLSRYFGTSAQFWMNLQVNFDLEVAVDKIGSEIQEVIRPHRAA